MYNSVMFVSQGDIYPVGDQKTGIAALLMFFAGFINFYLLGKFGILVENITSG